MQEEGHAMGGRDRHEIAVLSDSGQNTHSWLAGQFGGLPQVVLRSDLEQPTHSLGLGFLPARGVGGVMLMESFWVLPALQMEGSVHSSVGGCSPK